MAHRLLCIQLAHGAAATVSFERKLFLLYVINDTLHQAKKKIDAAPAVSNRHPLSISASMTAQANQPIIGFRSSLTGETRLPFRPAR